jgi:hypothetical protein
MERKNTVGEYHVAYADYATFDNVHYSKHSGGVWGTIVPQMNHLDASVSASPRPCYLSNGECYALWSQFPNFNVWGSGGCSGSVVTSKNLQLNLFIEGRYNETSNDMIGDTVKILLRNNFAPYLIIDSAKGFVNSSGIGSFNFPNALNGTNYYIVIKHRNSIETWSKSPGQSFTGDVLNFDFTFFTQAYGGNMILVDLPSRYGIYSGDVDQNDFVNLSDVLQTYNDANNFITGYVVTDVTGNNQVDLSDIVIVYNNSNNFVTVSRP